MLKNYIKIAFRSLWKRRFYTFLNITGLSVSIACCIIIYLYISYNTGFDKFHPYSGSTFRLVNEVHLDKTEYDKGSSFGMLKAMKEEIPQVVKSTVAMDIKTLTVEVDGSAKSRFVEESNAAYTTSEWFNVFNPGTVRGNAAALNEANTVILSEQTAKKYFGTIDVIGRTIKVERVPLKIAAIIINPVQNSDLKKELYISLASLKNIEPTAEDLMFTDWSYLNSTNAGFVVLKNPTGKAQVEKLLMKMAEKKMGPDISKYYKFKLLPLTEIHFDQRYGGPVQKSLLLVLALIGILIVAIVAINYINMVIAQQFRRSAEIGTRKVLGGSSRQLFNQFIVETIISCTVAAVISLLLVVLILPVTNAHLFTDAPLNITSFSRVLLFTGILILFITACSGIYPAIILSKVNLISALKNAVPEQKFNGRKVLILTQNVAAQVLIICTIVIVLQVRFLKNTDKGFDRKAVISVPLYNASAEQKSRLSTLLSSVSGIRSFTFCHRSPASDSRRGATVQYNSRPEWEKWPVRFAIGDSAYSSTFGLKILAGRNIRPDSAGKEFLVNETMVEMLKADSRDVIGKPLTVGDSKGSIVGVVKDFNVKSLHERIEPSVLFELPELEQNLAIKLPETKTSQLTAEIEKAYLQIFPDKVFSFRFVDEQIDRLYKQETLQQRLIVIAATIAVLISTLGILGLISLITLQRTKEIGIRKVLGASLANLVVLLSGDFFKLISIAFIIAGPVAYYFMQKWLQDFAYRIQIQWWMFALAGLTAVAVALLTISFQSIKAGLANPVKSLRAE